MKINSISQWLLNYLPNGQPTDIFFTDFADRLLQAGVRIDRMVLFVTTPHPTVFGRRFVWQKGKGVKIIDAPQATSRFDIYINSPVYEVRHKGYDIHFDLDAPKLDGEYSVYGELRNDGMRDYFIQALPFMGGNIEAISYATSVKDGFSDAELTIFKEIRMPLARIVEIFALNRVAKNSLNANVGRGTGERILKGKIHLGDSDKINAVILFCDLRRSSLLAEQYGSEKFIHILNDFFSSTAGVVLNNGGDVLRFIGDAFLAIFPINDDKDSDIIAAQKALNSAIEANKSLKKSNEVELSAGFGLHMGEVVYGNIGTPERLEFTVIGAAANEAARIEGKCNELGYDILVSEKFSSKLTKQKWQDLGLYKFKNISKEMRLFTII